MTFDFGDVVLVPPPIKKPNLKKKETRSRG
jgi:hypothetical protein